MRIGIDARPLVEKKTGIGYYLQYLLENILKYDTKNEYYLFSSKKIYFENKNKYKNLKIVEDSETKLKATFWYLINTKKKCKEYNIDVYWGTQHILPLGLKNTKKILTIHDLVSFDFKNTMNNFNYLINRALIPSSLAKSDVIVAVSNSTKERINFHFPNIDEKKINVIYEDVVIEDVKGEINSDFFAENRIEKHKYIMFLGTIEPRKNIRVLINALEKINRYTNLKLVLCGKYGWKCKFEKESIENNKENIIFLNYVTDKEKNYLMKNAFAFIFPSVYEGFGLPVLEAMRNGTIALVANNSSLKELVEKDELKFEAHNSEELEDKIIELYNNKELYKECLNYCRKREKDFSWDNISKEYINIINKLD